MVIVPVQELFHQKEKRKANEHLEEHVNVRPASSNGLRDQMKD
jgi:hypothetical protein